MLSRGSMNCILHLDLRTNALELRLTWTQQELFFMHLRKHVMNNDSSAFMVLNVYRSIDGNDPKNDWRINESVDKFKGWLDAENGKNYGVIQNHLSASLSCISGSIYYERLQHDGPHYGPITKKKPLVAK